VPSELAGCRRVVPLATLETEIDLSATTRPSVASGTSAPRGTEKDGAGTLIERTLGWLPEEMRSPWRRQWPGRSPRS